MNTRVSMVKSRLKVRCKAPKQTAKVLSRTPREGGVDLRKVGPDEVQRLCEAVAALDLRWCKKNSSVAVVVGCGGAGWDTIARGRGHLNTSQAFMKVSVGGGWKKAAESRGK